MGAMRSATALLLVRLAAALWLAALPVLARADTLTVFAAASTGTALEEIAGAWEAETGNTVVLSLAGSSALARQIAAGAPADVFISASAEWVDTLEASGDVRPETRTPLLSNRLVLVAHGAAAPVDLTPPLDLVPLLGDGRLAMALVDAVPAGIYGKAALTSLGAWESVAPRIAQADNVRAALALVAVGAAPYGIVYATDAAAEPRVQVVATFPPDSHPPISYVGAAVTRGDAALAEAFLAYLRGTAARAAFARQGFLPPDD